MPLLHRRFWYLSKKGVDLPINTFPEEVFYILAAEERPGRRRNECPVGQFIGLRGVRQFATLFLGVVICFVALLGLPDAAYQRAGTFANTT